MSVTKWIQGIGAMLAVWMAAAAAVAQEPSAAEPAVPPAVEPAESAARTGPAKVMIIPVREAISKPELFILRRGVKTAIDEGYDTIILDMDTPGGRVDVTFDMLQALERFSGKTATYVNTDAISAGALISAGTDEIYFAPGGVIGAAAPVLATGGEIDETMRAKIVSYLRARARAISGEEGYRADVISAMIDINYELEIDGVVIKPKGELLTLTASEAMREYGDPPVPLLGAGIVDSLDGLVTRLHGPGMHEVVRLEVTWSERVSQYLTAFAPLLVAGGLFLLFIEFKTPGFGVFGVGGAAVLAAVFFSHYIAGLSGHEPALFFFIGVLLVVVELLFFPGLVFVALTGGLLMLGSLVWAMMDVWPDEPIQFDPEVVVGPLASVMTGLVLAVIVFLLLLRFLPQGGVWGRLVLDAAVGGEPHTGPLVRPELPAGPDGADPLIGRTGVAVTALYPSGQVEVAGRRYEARLLVGSAQPGTPVMVTRRAEFGLEVEELTP
jgi:membrane-bound serine protease (ClpP class)